MKPSRVLTGISFFLALVFLYNECFAWFGSGPSIQGAWEMVPASWQEEIMTRSMVGYIDFHLYAIACMSNDKLLVTDPLFLDFSMNDPTGFGTWKMSGDILQLTLRPTADGGQWRTLAWRVRWENDDLMVLQSITNPYASPRWYTRKTK